MRLRGFIGTFKRQKTKRHWKCQVCHLCSDLGERMVFIYHFLVLPRSLLSLLFSFCPFPLFSYSRQMQCSAALERGKSLSYFCPPNLQHILTQLVLSECFHLAENIKTWKSVTRAVIQNKLCQKVYKVSGWVRTLVRWRQWDYHFHRPLFAAVSSAFCQIAGGGAAGITMGKKAPGKHKEWGLPKEKMANNIPTRQQSRDFHK